MRIRPAEQNDVPVLRDIFYRSRVRHFFWVDHSRFTPGDFDSATEGELLWVAEDTSERPAGFVSVWAPEHFIHNLFVSPEHTGEGYGTALLWHCLARIGRPARLKCAQRNHAAIGFYRSRDWRVIGEGFGAEGPYYELEFNGEVPPAGEPDA